MTDKAKDGGADELMKTNPRVTGDQPEDVEGHRQPTVKDGAPEGQTHKQSVTGAEDDVEGHQHKAKDGAPDGFSGPKKPLFTGEDDDVEAHSAHKAKDAGQDGFSGPKKPLYTGEDDDVEGHRQPLPK